MMLNLPPPYASRLLHDEPLARFTAARLGGPADLLYLARDSTDELAAVVSAAWAQDMPVRVLGGGANVLVSDRGFRGLIVINHAAEAVVGDQDAGCNARATSGTGLTVLARRCAARGLSGLEWAAGVPGTVGGAVVNNAGAHGSDIAASLHDAVVLDAERGAVRMTRDDLAFGYRASALKARADRRFLVLAVTFVLRAGDPEQIQAKMDEFAAYRRRTQPPGASLGSIFKNPPGDYAGRLIEAAGLKGFQVGSVLVSPVHANFFVNTGGGTAEEYDALIRHVQAVVYERSGVALEMEIERVGEW